MYENVRRNFKESNNAGANTYFDASERDKEREIGGERVKSGLPVITQLRQQPES